MRIKFEATDASGKVHKRSSTSHVYSHCVVIHFAAHPPSNLWPKGIAACSHACLFLKAKLLSPSNQFIWGNINVTLAAAKSADFLHYFNLF